MCRRLWILRRRKLPVVTCVSSLSCAQVNVCVPISYLQSCGVRVHVCDCVSTVSVLSVCIAAAVHEACACRVRVPVRDRCRHRTRAKRWRAQPAREWRLARTCGSFVCGFYLALVGRATPNPPAWAFFRSHTSCTVLCRVTSLVCVWCVGLVCVRERPDRESRERDTLVNSLTHTQRWQKMAKPRI